MTTGTCHDCPPNFSVGEVLIKLRVSLLPNTGEGTADGSRILELSTKCAPTEGFQVAAEVRAFLTGKGVNLSGEQQTKTKAALEYFAASLATAAEA
jgi:hypothetical protein